jgi:hypothetical protein
MKYPPTAALHGERLPRTFIFLDIGHFDSVAPGARDAGLVFYIDIEFYICFIVVCHIYLLAPSPRNIFYYTGVT